MAKKKTPKQESLCQNKRKFIKLFPEHGAIWPTMQALGYKSRAIFYVWCDNDPAFKEIYLNELLPNRRDGLVSLLYKTAIGKLGTTTETTLNIKLGREITKEVPVVMPQTQLTALFGMLKASDHRDTGEDRLIFVEKHQLEVSGKDGEPIILKVVYDDSNKRIYNTSAES